LLEELGQLLDIKISAKYGQSLELHANDFKNVVDEL
jgi:hypothetical protein